MENTKKQFSHHETKNWAQQQQMKLKNFEWAKTNIWLLRTSIHNIQPPAPTNTLTIIFMIMFYFYYFNVFEILNKPNFITIWLCIFSYPNDSIAILCIVTTQNWFHDGLRISICILIICTYATFRYHIYLSFFVWIIRALCPHKHFSSVQKGENIYKSTKIPWINVFVQSPKHHKVLRVFK